MPPSQGAANETHGRQTDLLMKPDTTITTTHERLDNQTADITRNVDGQFTHGFDISGVYHDSDVLCAECVSAAEISDSYDIDMHISTTDEVPLPGHICENCGQYLDTYLIVDRNQDPEMWHKLQWNQQLGLLDSPIMDFERLCKKAKQLAYEKGYESAKELDQLIDLGCESVEEYLEHSPEACEPPTDGALWANTILPELRAISGHIDDMGVGTYQTAMNSASECLSYEVLPAYQEGWYDKCSGSEKSEEYK